MGILRQRFNQGRNTVGFIQQIGEDNESLSKPRAANENLLLRLVLFAPFFDHLTLPIYVIRDILRCSARLVFLPSANEDFEFPIEYKHFAPASRLDNRV